ncbi:hypothetical protein [Coraliomargarita parva]|uniref:hypothetical protein n=1 Tax=Coraliomargarita parva TaxID=3014050 RepID=UPI0022B4D76E|nr:hypothetical protein [Coraliomargarita parva]
MDFYHTTDMDGTSELNPDANRLRELIAELDGPNVDDAPHPDISLVHNASGWSLTLYPSGIVTFENLDEPDCLPRHLVNVSRREALKLWLELSKGEIDLIHSRPWMRDTP